MKKKIISLFLAVVMIVGMIPLGAISAFAETGEIEYRTVYNTLYGQTLGEWDTVCYYYVDSDTSCTAEEAGVSGLTIADNSEVHIIVKEGVTLYCKGGDGSGQIGGGAGIEVPVRSALYLEGEGTVIAIGGNAANGADGVDGQAGNFYVETESFALWSWKNYYYYGGDGGAGGNGGGGAGAGIGTIGGNGGRGGVGGKGDGGDGDENHVNVTAGERGYNGLSADNNLGTIRTASTVKLKATGGARGKGGNSKINNGLTYGDTEDNFHTAVPGCAGGGGQGGGAGASVGTGGRGGGGGAGGNGSAAIYTPHWISFDNYFGAILYSGYGGGNTDGNYVADSNMGQGGDKYDMTARNRQEYYKYPYKERNFGGAGGTDGVEHIHDFDENNCCTVCAARVLLIEDGVLLEYNGFGGTVVIPEGVTKIANNVFAGNKTVTDVVFPSTLEEIGSSAFNSSGITSVTFPPSVKTIGHNAFQNCASLTSVEFPDEGAITILNSTFQGIPLTSLDIPVSVKAIGYNAFRNCASLRSVTVHWAKEDEIVTPQSDAFAGIASDCALSVPQNTTALYKKNPVWGKFSLISDTMLYMAYDPETETFVQKTSPVAPTTIPSSEGSVVLPGGWYAAGDATIGGSLTFEGDAYVIFENGKTLTVNGGVVVGTELTFYAQTTALDDMGGLYVPGTAGEVPGISCSGKTLNIHGGNIKVWGGNLAAGIGGANREYGGHVTVYGGHVEAHSKYEGAGIGGGSSNGGLSFTMYGGKVNAYGVYSSGIGGGCYGFGGTITINGGEVYSSGNIGAYSYNNNYGTTITINGGKVTVDSAGIGGKGSTVNINGGEVKINQGTIGAGYNTGNSTVNIRGGIIDANYSHHAAIGGDIYNVNVNIYGGSIKAKSDKADAVVATSVKVYPDAEKCEIFTVKDFSGNELSGSPVSEEKEINDILSENRQIIIDLNHAHTFTDTYVDNGDGTHSLKCDVCGVLNAAENHTFVHHACVCGLTNDHNFTGEYKDNGDGTHSRKCTGCDEYGATENHTFENYVCICGAEDLVHARLKAKTAIAEAMEDATASASAVVANKAVEDIEKAASLAEISQITEKAIADIKAAEKELLDAKKEAIEVLNAKLNDDTETVVQGAVLAITNATSPESVTAIYDLAIAKIEAIAAIVAAITPENAALAGDGIAAVTNATDTEQVAAAKETALAKMQAADNALIKAKADAKDEINAKKTLANKTIANTALADIEAATLSTEVASILETALAKMQAADASLVAAKNTAKAQIESKISDENATIAATAIENINKAETEDAVATVLNTALADMQAADDALAEAKTNAKEQIEGKTTPANADIADKALADIEAATLKTTVASILETALADMQAADASLVAAKNAAKAQIESKKTDQNAGIASAALENINKAETEDAVATVLNTALSDMKAADDALAKAKTDAKAEIGSKKTLANAAIADKALADIEAAKTSAEVESVLSKALADMKAVDDTLAEAKTNAIAAIIENKTESNKIIAEAAIAEIDAAITVEEVVTIKNNALNVMQCADMIAEAEALREAAVCEEAKAILSKAIADMNAAETVKDVAAILETAKTQSTQKDNEYANKLAYYLEDINKYIQDFSGDETIAAVENVKEQLRACKSISGLETIYNENEDMLDFLYYRDDAADTLRNFAEDSDKPETVRALATEALPKVLAAETMEELEAICDEYFGKMRFEESKWETVDQYRAYLESDEYPYSDEMKAIYRDLMQKAMAAEDWDDLECLYGEDNIRTEAQFTREWLFSRIALVEEDDLYEIYYYFGEAYETEEYRAFVEATLAQLLQEEKARLAVIDKVRTGEEEIDCLEELVDEFYAFTDFIRDKLNFAAYHSYYLLDKYGYSDPYKVLTRDFLEEYVSALTEEQEMAIREGYENALDFIEYKEKLVRYLYDWLDDVEELSETMLAVLEAYTERIMAAADMQEAVDIYEQGFDAIYIVYTKERLTAVANEIIADEAATETEKAFAEELLTELSGITSTPHLGLDAEQLAAIEAQMELIETKYTMLDERQELIRIVNFWINHEDATDGEKSEEFRMAFKNIIATLDNVIDGLIPAVKAAEADGYDAMFDAMKPFRKTYVFLTEAVLSDCADYCTYLYQYAGECSDARWELARAYIDEYSKATSYDELNEIEEKYEALFELLEIKEDYVKRLRQDFLVAYGSEVYANETLQAALKEAEAYILAAESEEDAERRYTEVLDTLFLIGDKEYLTAAANSVLADKTAPDELKAYARELLAELENATTADDFDALYGEYLLIEYRYYFLRDVEEDMNVKDGMKTPEFLAAYENVRATYNSLITDLIPTAKALQTEDDPHKLEDDLHNLIDEISDIDELCDFVLRYMGDIAECLLDNERSDLEKKLARLYIDDLSKVTTQEELDAVIAAYDERYSLLSLKEDKCAILQQKILDYGGTDELWAIYAEQETKILLAEDEDTVKALYDETRELLNRSIYSAYLLDIANEILNDETASAIQKEFANEMAAAVEAAKTTTELFTEWNRYYPLVVKVEALNECEGAQTSEEAPDFFKTDAFRTAVENIMATLNGTIDSMIPDFRTATDEELGDINDAFYERGEALVDLQLDRIGWAVQEMTKEPCSDAMKALYLEYIDAISKMTSQDDAEDIYAEFEAKYELLKKKEEYVNIMLDFLNKLDVVSEKMQKAFDEGKENIMKAATLQEAELAFEEAGIKMETQYLADHISYNGVSLTLKSDISINFYMGIDVDWPDNMWDLGEMTFTIGEGEKARTVTGIKAQKNENGWYFACPVTALEMNETVTATFSFYGNDFVQEYSVEQYIEAILNGKDKDGNDYSDEMKLLVRKIANYGHYAQIYLESIHTNVTIGDDGYAAMEKFDDVDIKVDAAIEALANYKVEVTGTSDNISLYGSTVYFDSATALNYYVTVENGVKPTATAQNTVTGKSKDVEIKLYKDNIYIVSVKDITATGLADEITVTIDDDITITGSVFAYCNSVVQAHNIDGASDKDIFAVNAMAAFYEYYEAACEYAKTQVQE